MRSARPLLFFTLLSATVILSQSSTSMTEPPANAMFQAGSSTGAWQAIHDSALVIDTHADTPGRFVDENFDLAQDAGHGYLDFNKIRAGNLGAEFFSIWVEPTAHKGHEAQDRKSVV